MKCATGFLFLALLANLACGGRRPSPPEEVDDDDDCETPDCPKNEDFREDYSCSELCTPCPRSLPKRSMEARCFCDSTMVRLNGKCVDRKKCSLSTEETPPCGKNQEWKRGNSCSDKCRPDSGSLACPKNIYWGCFCIDGYKDVGGSCVLPKHCPCGKNKVYSMCGSACPEHCPDSGMACITLCVEGCICKQPFVQKDGICVSKEKACPKVPAPQRRDASQIDPLPLKDSIDEF